MFAPTRLSTCTCMRLAKSLSSKLERLRQRQSGFEQKTKNGISKIRMASQSPGALRLSQSGFGKVRSCGRVDPQFVHGWFTVASWWIRGCSRVGPHLFQRGSKHTQGTLVQGTDLPFETWTRSRWCLSNHVFPIGWAALVPPLGHENNLALQYF